MTGGFMTTDGWKTTMIGGKDGYYQRSPIAAVMDDFVDFVKAQELTEFEAVLEEILAMHRKKNQDYGSDEDPYANVTDSQAWGVDPWIGASVRLSDKERRLKLAASGKALANETVEDSLIDNCVYNIIRLILWRRQHKPAEGGP